MRKLYILLLLCAVVSMTQAQKITRNYKNQSLSRVLEDLKPQIVTRYLSSITT